jgi:hypothetical protein
MGKIDFLFQYTPRSGENMIDRPVNQFLVPVAQLANKSFIIPNDYSICLLEFYVSDPQAYNRTHARRIGRALCKAGVPVFDERGRLRVYCPRSGARVVHDAFQFHSGPVSAAAEYLRNCGELERYDEIAELCGHVEYHLEGDDILVVERERRYILPRGATLL